MNGLMLDSVYGNYRQSDQSEEKNNEFISELQIKLFIQE